MLLDVAENRASFKALAVEDLLLETTETGHPAFQIKPSPLPKAFVQGPNWDSAEIKIFSQAEQYMGPPGVKGILHDDGDATGDASSSSGSERYMTSWMVSVHGDEVGGDGVLPHEVPPGCSQPFSYEPMFYPKKIGPATRNMLLDVNFNPVTFAAWWATTNISNDFWIENEECLVRVHVIPRRSFFSPSHWRTQNTPHKEKLLSVLGAVRTINAVSCKSHKEFPAVHGLWSEVRDESSFPVLWIGRSIFRRKIPMLESSHSPHDDGQENGPLHVPRGDESQDVVGVQQGRTFGRGQGQEPLGERSMDDRRTPVGDPRRSSQSIPQRPSERDEGHGDDDHRPAQGPCYGTGLPHPPVRHPRHDHADPEGPGGDELSVRSGLREVRREGLRGHASELQDVGLARSGEQRQPVGGSRDVRELVARTATQVEQQGAGEDPGGPVRRGDVRHDPLCGGLNGILGCTPSRIAGGADDAPAQGQDRGLSSASTPNTPYETFGRGTSDAYRHKDGAGDPTGGRRGGSVPGGEAGAAQGSARHPAGEVIENYGEDTGDGVPNHGVSYYIEDDYEETDTDDEGNYDDYLDHFGFDEAAVTYVTEGERNGADINPGGSGDGVQRETPRVRDRRGQVEVCEAKAKAKLEKKEYAFDDLLEIAKILPLRRLRKGKALCRSGGYSFEYFLGGMYTHGNMKGLSRQSGEMPWVVKYMNSFMKAQGYGQWSSFVLFKNAATNVHADSHNLAGTTIKTVSFGPFTGGELWMSDFDRDPDIPGTVWRKDAAGNEIPGYLVDTRHQVYTFDGKAKHATQPWIGERWVLSLYTTRGYQESTADLRDQLRELRFPLRGLPLLPEVHGQAQGKFVRPVKSMRKSLWKKASRLAALTTWCATAGLSCTAEAFPLTRGREAVALYEIGGVEKTLEVTGLDYLVAEPIDDLYNFTTTSVSETVQSTIRELTPAVVWVHGDKAMGYFDGIYDHLCEHVDKGRQLAVKAPPGDPCWESPGLNRILRRYEGAWRCREQEPDVIRVNDIFYYQDDAADAHAMSQFDTYVADHTADRGGEDSEGTTAKIGAEAISFEKGKNLAPEVKSSLRRLHQNLGHPSNTDLARHLRLAGADPVVIDACKRLRCQVCQRNKRGSTPKPASLPTLLEFNQVVAVDAFYVYDCEGTKVELMMAIDVGTGFALAGELQGHSTLTMEATFCSL